MSKINRNAERELTKGLEITSQTIFFDDGIQGRITKSKDFPDPEVLIGSLAKQAGYRHGELIRYSIIVYKKKEN